VRQLQLRLVNTRVEYVKRPACGQALAALYDG